MSIIKWMQLLLRHGYYADSVVVVPVLSKYNFYFQKGLLYHVPSSNAVVRTFFRTTLVSKYILIVKN